MTLVFKEYSAPGCECGCLCCESCAVCEAYRESGHFGVIAAGMFVVDGHEAEAIEFVRLVGHNPDEVFITRRD